MKRQASHGAAISSGGGESKAISYTPEANYHGSDSFVVQVEDGQGGSDTITVNVDIAAVNDVPSFAEGDKVTVSMSEDGLPTAFNLILHGIDADGDELTWSIITQASHGMAIASGTGETKKTSAPRR